MTSRSLTDLNAAELPWTALASASDNLFSSWEWAKVWWRHFGSDRALSLTCVENGAGQPLALLPLQSERRKGLTLTRFIGHGVADQLGPVCRPADTEVALESLRSAAESDILIAERLPAERAWRTLRGHVLRDEAMPTINIAQARDWESYLSSRSVKLRRDVRRRGRRLRRLGVGFRLAGDPGRLARDMDALIALHAKRWDSRSQAFGGPREQFHREFAALALDRGWLRLWLAEADGAPVAAIYGLRFGDVEYGYQLGRDPGWERDGVGAGVHEHAIQQAFADGMREFRLLRGDEEYKLRYATEVRRVLTIAIPRSARGRCALAATRSLARTQRGRSVLRRTLG